MTQREREPRAENPASPDGSRFLWVDPEEILKDNPAALIVNEETYQNMKARFSQERFEQYPPEATWTEVWTPEGMREKLLEIDGLTRTGFARDVKTGIINPPPGVPREYFDQIRIYNVTGDSLNNPRIVPPGERRPDQTALTNQQYLRAVVPHTIVHVAIAPERIAGFLCDVWVGKVGPDIADRFPGVAALGFLANRRNSIGTDHELQRTLNIQEPLMVNEQPEERKRLNKALRETAEIIRRANLLFKADQLEEAAYVLIGSGAPIIGGTKEARKQIHGLLKSIAFENKLTRELRMQLYKAETTRMDFARALEEAFKRFALGSPNNERERTVIRETIDDNSLTLSQTLQVVTADSPERERSRVIISINRQALKDQYRRIVQRQNLTDREQILIDRLGDYNLSLLEPQIPGMVRDIQFTVAILRQSEEWQRRLEEDANELIKSGVNPTTIANAKTQMSRRQKAVLEAGAGTLADRAKALQTIVDEFHKTVTEQKLKYDVGKEVEKVFSQELAATADTHLRDRLVWAVIHDNELDKLNPASINKWLRDLKKLDEDLQTEIMAGTIEMAAGLRMQNQRRRRAAETPPPHQTPTEQARPAETPAGGEAPPHQAPRVEQPTQDTISQEEIKRRRIERGNQRLRTEVLEPHLIPAIRVLATIDLSPEELQTHLKRMLGDAEIAIEKFRAGHPNVVRVMDEDHPHLQSEVTRLREVIVNLEMELGRSHTR